MCGITGWVDWHQDLSGEKAILAEMVKVLMHRGPDDQGFYFSNHVALGHRRLSVMDPARGAQPMIRSQGAEKYIITYNGELYNTLELKQELLARGYYFTTECDTEVLLTAYIEWGTACLEKLNGIFAFAVWDELRQTLFLARDRIGVKPLFYAKLPSGLVFASEPKALLAHPAIEPIIDKTGLGEIFLIGPGRTPGCAIFRDMAEIKPGHYAIFNRYLFKTVPYWQLQSKPHQEDFQQTVDTVRSLVEDAVTRQLTADVPVCTLLSGGLDSSAITAIASLNKQNAQVITYSVNYLDNEKYFKPDLYQPDSDSFWSDKVAKFLGTEHHEILLPSEKLYDILPQAMISRDFPGMADVDTSLYLFCQEIKNGATVALSGECADEIFGGYPWFYRPDLINLNTFPWSDSVDMRNSWLSAGLEQELMPYRFVQERYEQAVSEVPRLVGETSIDQRMREKFYLTLTRFMPTLLDRKDRMSMASGLEVRVPFCDHRIVEYMWNVPWSMKYYKDREKGLLRNALTGLLPQDVLWRKKSPYPKSHHPVFSNLVREKLSEIINDHNSPLLPLINVENVKNYLKANISNNKPWYGQLMGISQLFAYFIQLHDWLTEYKVRIV